jgi:hypothetical protein
MTSRRVNPGGVARRDKPGGSSNVQAAFAMRMSYNCAVPPERNDRTEEARLFMRTDKKIGQILVDLKVLSHFDVERILESVRKRRRHQKFGQMARDMGLAREEEILAALAVQMELLPGIKRLTLKQILQQLQAETTS